MQLPGWLRLPVRMRHALARRQHVGCAEIVAGDVGAANVERHRKPWRPHERFQHLARRHDAGQMPRPDGQLDVRPVERRKERHAQDVVVVAMGEEDVEIVDAVLDQRQSGGAQARARVEDQRMRPAAHLDAGGVAAVAEKLPARHGHAAAHTPEPYPELVGHATSSLWTDMVTKPFRLGEGRKFRHCGAWRDIRIAASRGSRTPLRRSTTG